MSPTLKTENMQILPKMQTPQPTWWPRLPTSSARSCTRSWGRGTRRTWSSPRSACPPSWPWSRLEPRVLPLKRFQISIFVKTPLKNKMLPNNRDSRLDNGPRCIRNVASNQLYVSFNEEVSSLSKTTSEYLYIPCWLENQLPEGWKSIMTWSHRSYFLVYRCKDTNIQFSAARSIVSAFACRHLARLQVWTLKNSAFDTFWLN